MVWLLGGSFVLHLMEPLFPATPTSCYNAHKGHFSMSSCAFAWNNHAQSTWNLLLANNWRSTIGMDSRFPPVVHRVRAIIQEASLRVHSRTKLNVGTMNCHQKWYDTIIYWISLQSTYTEMHSPIWNASPIPMARLKEPLRWKTTVVGVFLGTGGF